MSEYVNCESIFSNWRCRKKNSICENFINKVASLENFEKIECGVYAFTEKGLIKYESGGIRSLSEEEVKKLEIFA